MNSALLMMVRQKTSSDGPATTVGESLGFPSMSVSILIFLPCASQWFAKDLEDMGEWVSALWFLPCLPIR